LERVQHAAAEELLDGPERRLVKHPVERLAPVAVARPCQLPKLPVQRQQAFFHQ